MSENPTVGPGIRTHLRALCSLAASGELAANELPATIRMCLKIMDPESENRPRDRLGAAKLLTTIASMGGNAEIDLDKIQRLENEKPTSRTTVTINYGPGGPQWTPGADGD